MTETEGKIDVEHTEDAPEAVEMTEEADVELEPGEIIDDEPSMISTTSEDSTATERTGIVTQKRYTNPFDDPERRGKMKRLMAQQRARQRRTVSIVRAPREPRHEQPKTATIREDALHLYGTDACSTDEIFAYFASYSPKYIEWIDDSSCNVVFASAECAARALTEKRLETQEALQTSYEQHLKFDPVTMELVVSSSTTVRKHKHKAASTTTDGDVEMEEGQLPSEVASTTGTETSDEIKKSALLPWVRASPLCVGNGMVAKLEIRQATTEDIRTEPRPSHSSRYYGKLVKKINEKRKREAEKAEIIHEAEREAFMPEDFTPEDEAKGVKRTLQAVVFGDDDHRRTFMVDTTSKSLGDLVDEDGGHSTLNKDGLEMRHKRRRGHRHRKDPLDGVVFD